MDMPEKVTMEGFYKVVKTLFKVNEKGLIK
jgi:hypothetical protein